MLARLRKQAAISGALREAALEKEAGLLGMAGRGVVAAAKARPIETALTLGAGTLTAVGAPKAAVGNYRKSMAGFDPAVQRQLLGATPVPPGTT